MKYEYLKGSEKDFEGAPESAMVRIAEIGVNDCISIFADKLESGSNRTHRYDGSYNSIIVSASNWTVIAERRPITDESDLSECFGKFCDSVMRSIGSAESTGGGNADGIYAFNMKDEEFIDDFVTFGKYDRQCKGVVIDVYDVLQAFEVVNPALQHLIKKALCAGLRGHKKREQDLVEILESAKRAIELEGK